MRIASKPAKPDDIIAFVLKSTEAMKQNAPLPFSEGDTVKHCKTGHLYVILLDRSAKVVIENNGKPAYAYRRKGGRPGSSAMWIRDADEMEDGRFELVKVAPASESLENPVKAV